MKCEVCGKTKGKMSHHHLTYEPPQEVILCWDCHITLHSMNRLKIYLPQFFEWIEKYGDLWKRGTEEYLRSERHKEVKRKAALKQYHKKRNDPLVWREHLDKRKIFG